MRSLSDDELEEAFKGACPRTQTGPAREHGLRRLLQSVVGTPPVPTRIGRYVVEEILGQSRRGAIFRAYDPQRGRAVVVKVIQGTAGQLRALKHEAQTLVNLRHPDVVRVLDVDTIDDGVYVAMEHVQGVTLRTWLRAHPDAPWRDVVELLAQAGRGLLAVHEAGMVHNDFGPDNVLVGDGKRVRVVGFAGARDKIEHTTLADQLAFLQVLRDALLRGSRVRLPRRLRRLTELAAAPRDGGRASLASLVRTLEELLSPGRAERDRALLLERVRRLWIDGVLRESLRGDPLVPLGLQAAQGALDEPVRTRSLSSATSQDLPELLDQTPRGLLLLGGAGSGKTTVLLDLARALLEEADTDPALPAPVVLNLSSFSREDTSLEGWIEAELLTKYSLPRRSTRRWIEKGQLVLLLDGLDEVRESLQSICIEAINALVRGRRLPVVVCARDEAYRAMRSRVALSAALVLQPLDKDGAQAFLARLGERGRELAAALESDAALEPHARTPLVLRVLELAGVQMLEDSSSLPEALHRRYIEAVFERRAATGPYSCARVVEGLIWLARAMQRAGQSELWLERIQASWLPSRVGRWMAVGLGLVLMLAAVFVLNTGPLVPFFDLSHTVRSGITVALVVVPLTLAFVRTLQVRPVEALTWSWTELQRHLTPTLGWGLLGAAVYGAIFSMEISLILATPALLVLAGLRGLSSAEVPARIRPNEGIRQSARNAVVLGAVCGVVTGAIFALVVVSILEWRIGLEALMAVDAKPGWPMFLGAAACFGSLAGLMYGGYAVVLHAALRLVIAATGPLPLRLRPFLDHAAERGLLRRVGGGYIFAHHSLLEYLAGPSGPGAQSGSRM